MKAVKLGKYLSLEAFCTCTQTYQKYRDRIDPYPQSEETLAALRELNRHIIDPIIDEFGRDRFRLTYGFCSKDLRKYLEQKDPKTGIKNGRVAPSLDQHMAHEINRNGRYYCDRLGASCDFLIRNLKSDRLVDWILDRDLPFDSLYFYGGDRPIHISHGPQHKRDIWTFTASGKPTKRGIEKWIETVKNQSGN